MVTKNRSVVAGSRQEGPGSIHDGNLKFPSRRKSKVQEAPEYEYFYHPLHVIARDPNAIGASIPFAQIREGIDIMDGVSLGRKLALSCVRSRN